MKRVNERDGEGSIASARKCGSEKCCGQKGEHDE